MQVMNGGQQREVYALLTPSVGDVVEIGHGPGVLLRLLAARDDVGHLIGIEPSLEMRTMAVRGSARQVAAGRMEVRAGDAAATGLPDAVADLVVSVNTVAIWPDLDAGVAELRRVLRPGGRLLLSWHGGDHPARTAKALLLADDVWTRIEAAVAAVFPQVQRRNTRRCTVLDARNRS